jgi:crotonobetainyl-CoA:carnitine CoA-transferase CaiB-like acyl-CoA transferase
MTDEMFQVLHRNKRGMTLDLRKPAAREVLKRLVRDADILVDSFRPGVMGELGVGYEVLKAENPKLVFCALTGYGQDGPYRDRAGHDNNYLGYAGVLDQIGKRGGPAVLSNVQIADLAGGGLTAVVGILAAVIRARATGQGGFVDISMLDGSLALQVVSLSTQRTVGQSKSRGDDMLSGAIPNYDVYPCKDGKYFILGSLEPKFWQAFCKAVGRPELGNRPLSAGPAVEGLRKEVAELFLTRTRDEWNELLHEHDACATPLLSLEESMQNEQVRARNMVVEFKGKPLLACPIKLDGYQFEVTRPAPKLGEHTREVLESAGYSPEEIQTLKQAGAI